MIQFFLLWNKESYCKSILEALIKRNKLFLNLNNLKKSLLLMHSFNITHNDIKPENIIYSPKF